MNLVNDSPWLLLVVGVALTLVPVPALFPGRVKYRPVEYLEIELRNSSWWKVWSRLLRTPIHWEELARGCLSMWCLLLALEAVRTQGRIQGFTTPWMVAGVAFLVAAVGLLLLFASSRRKEGAVAPVAYVAAAVFAALPLPAGTLALILALSTMLAFKSVSAFFWMLAIGLAGFGWLFGCGIAGTAGAGFAATPWLLAAFQQRDFVIPLRHSQGRRAAGSAAIE
ncbi:MAG: hypothetical protein FJ399_05065 [Verrucomicrobia bacterium]|nr:hypothetical protein [Verrucomicrobiota bacterium]